MFGIGLQQILFLSHKNIFEAIQNGGKTECFKLKQRSVIKFFCSWEVLYMWNFLKNMRCICRGTCYSPRNVSKWAKHGFPTLSLSWKDSPWSGNTLSDKENVPQSVKKFTLSAFWHRKGPISIDFFLPIANSFVKIPLLKSLIYLS